MKRLSICLTLTLIMCGCNAQTTQPLSTQVNTLTDRSKASGCPGGLAGAECETYKQGIEAGVSDHAAHKSDSFRRHEGGFEPRFEASFRAGYATGWYNNGK